MANEISFTHTLSFAKGNVASIGRTRTATPTVSGAKYISNVQNIGTTAEAIDIGDIGTPGWAWFRNLDATNFVTIRIGASGADLAKLLPGESASFRLAASNPYAIADSGACNVEYLIVEA